jgi:DNA-3-methyladenine glycosylase
VTLPKEYYQGDDVVAISKDLLGKKLFTNIDGNITGGIIVETEAYAGIDDKASHSYGGKRTKRNESMFLDGGITYVYMCYGIHFLLNIVTNKAPIPQAVLIRAIQPTDGIETMLKRRNKEKLDRSVAGGPGALSQALGITRSHDALPLQGLIIYIEEGEHVDDIVATPRVGVGYAGDDAFLPWRFRTRDCDLIFD